MGHPDTTQLSSIALSKPTTNEELTAWHRLYDAAVRYTDEQIARIMHALYESGQKNNTLVVIAGDHGEEIGEHGDFSHRFRLYDESIHVPLIFYHPDVKENGIDTLIDLRDLAPTILDLAGVPIPESYEGKPVLKIKEVERGHIMMESFYRGNCLFPHRPLYMGIRTKKYKYIWREWIDPLDKISLERVELYDLEIDRKEKHNIYNGNSSIVKYFNKLIVNRLKEIPEIDSSRASLKLYESSTQIT